MDSDFPTVDDRNDFAFQYLIQCVHKMLRCVLLFLVIDVDRVLGFFFFSRLLPLLLLLLFLFGGGWRELQQMLSLGIKGDDAKEFVDAACQTYAFKEDKIVMIMAFVQNVSQAVAFEID